MSLGLVIFRTLDDLCRPYCIVSPTPFTSHITQLTHNPAASVIESESETVIRGLQQFGSRYNLASMQAMRADRFRKATPQETAFMEGSDDEDSPSGSGPGGGAGCGPGPGPESGLSSRQSGLSGFQYTSRTHHLEDTLGADAMGM